MSCARARHAPNDVSLPAVLIGLALIGLAPLYSLLPENDTHGGSGSGGRSGSDGGGSDGDVGSASGGGSGAAVAARLRTAVAEARRSFGALLSQRAQRGLLAMRFALVCGWSVWLTVVPQHAAKVWGASPGDLGRRATCQSPPCCHVTAVPPRHRRASVPAHLRTAIQTAPDETAQDVLGHDGARAPLCSRGRRAGGSGGATAGLDGGSGVLRARRGGAAPRAPSTAAMCRVCVYRPRVAAVTAARPACDCRRAPRCHSTRAWRCGTWVRRCRRRERLPFLQTSRRRNSVARRQAWATPCGGRNRMSAACQHV